MQLMLIIAEDNMDLSNRAGIVKGSGINKNVFPATFVRLVYFHWNQGFAREMLLDYGVQAQVGKSADVMMMMSKILLLLSNRGLLGT
jgi:hypothetical protein